MEDFLTGNAGWIIAAAAIGLEILTRKIPKAFPILKLISKACDLLSGALEKVPGMKNKE